MSITFRPSFLFVALLMVSFYSAKSATPIGEGFRDNMRGARYGEIILVKGNPFSLKGEVYNTLGLNDCPGKEWKALNPSILQAQNHAFAVLLNGPRRFVMDQATLMSPGKVRTFGDLQARNLAIVSLSPTIVLKGKSQPYTENRVQRTSQFRYMKGRNVYELVSPGGAVYVMQSLSMQVDPKLDLADLPALGSRLHLPPGWSYRVIRPGSDLILTAKGEAKVLQDELKNSYQRME